MRVLPVFLSFLFIFNCESLLGQCPDRDSLWNRISSIRNSSSTNYSDKLKELLLCETQIKKCNENIDSVYTFLLLSIGVLYYRTADYNLAVQYTRRALQIIQSNEDKPAINKTSLIKYYFYLSIYYDSLRMPSKKNEAIDSCISKELAENSDFHFTSVVLETNVRDLYEKGDYNLCIDRSVLGETLIHRYYRFNDSMNRIIYFIYYKANSLKALKKFDEEEQFLQSKKSEFFKSKNRDNVGIIYRLFGNLYEARGDYKHAIEYFQKAFYYDKTTASKQISAGVLDEIGVIYLGKFRLNKLALEYFYKALSYANTRALANGSTSDSFYILGNIANVYVRMKLFDSSYFFFQKAFDNIKPGINETDLVSDIENYVKVNSVETVIKLVLDKANAYLQQYNHDKTPLPLKRALAIYKTADRLLTKIKEEQSELQSKLFWQKDAHSLYENAIEVAYLQNNFRDAFYFFEKSRAVLLNEQLEQQSKISVEDLIKQAQLKRRLLILERERDNSDIGSGKYLDVQKEIININQSLERLEQAIKKGNPLYFKISSDTSFITINDLQKYLVKSGQALVEIFSGDSAIYSLFMTGQNVYFYKINKQVLESSVISFISYISNPDLLNRKFESYIKTATQLYQLIFQNHPVPKGRMIISPDGNIFPFESLVTNTNTSSPAYFIYDHAVSYTYSARYLLTQFTGNEQNTQSNFLGIAPVNYAADFSLADLQGSDLSLKLIGSYYRNAKNLLATDASKGNFEREFSNYQIIQLYTHASDSSSRGEPVIYFADSALYLSDLIPENKPQTRLIVLSACETGRGKFYQGEGVFSFNRGFASLGIPASITNLWSVDNQSTYQITELFYKWLSKGIPADIALQKAKLEYMKQASKENKLPFYWAAIILAGKSDAIVDKKGFPWNEILVLTSLMGVVYIGWQKWKK